MSNSLDPDQARQNVGPDQGRNLFAKALVDIIKEFKVNKNSGIFLSCFLKRNFVVVNETLPNIPTEK